MENDANVALRTVFCVAVFRLQHNVEKGTFQIDLARAVSGASHFQR